MVTETFALKWMLPQIRKWQSELATSLTRSFLSQKAHVLTLFSVSLVVSSLQDNKYHNCYEACVLIVVILTILMIACDNMGAGVFHIVGNFNAFRYNARAGHDSWQFSVCVTVKLCVLYIGLWI